VTAVIAAFGCFFVAFPVRQFAAPVFSPGASLRVPGGSLATRAFHSTGAGVLARVTRRI
jgi:hypothetical protein